jgi:hypothetical protein
MKRLGIGSLLCGVGLSVYGMLNFTPSRGREVIGEYGPAYGYFYNTEARAEAAAGAVLTVAGLLLYKRNRSN